MSARTTQDFHSDTVAALDGVWIGDFEPTADTLIFELATDGGERFQLNLHDVLRALVICSESGVIPPLPSSWVSEAAAIHGRAFQENA